MNPISSLLQKRQQVTDQLANLGPMRRGCITEQYFEAALADGSKVRRGPYALYTYKDKQRTVSRRLSDPSMVEVYRRQIGAYRQFEQLTAELIAVGEQIADVALTQEVTLKKTKLGALNKKRR